MKKLTIIIVTFQSSKIIAFCLQKLNREKYEIIVVDNNSSDDTTAIAAKFLPSSHIIKLDKNSGFGRANNVALKRAKTPYALILNPDAFMEEADIEAALKIMDENSKIAIAGAVPYNCKIKENGELEIATNPSLEIKNNDNNIKFTRFITGAGMFMRLELMKKIGFFNEDFFLYCEDNEICKRVLKNGYQNALLKKLRLLHCSKQSSDSSGDSKISWHRLGWSKAFYIAATRGTMIGKFASLRITLKHLFLMAQDYLQKGKISSTNKYAAQGAISYFIGLKAFDKNGNPRMPK